MRRYESTYQTFMMQNEFEFCDYEPGSIFLVKGKEYVLILSEDEEPDIVVWNGCCEIGERHKAGILLGGLDMHTHVWYIILSTTIL